jgi:hypothetical protein
VTRSSRDLKNVRELPSSLAPTAYLSVRNFIALDWFEHLSTRSNIGHWLFPNPIWIGGFNPKYQERARVAAEQLLRKPLQQLKPKGPYAEYYPASEVWKLEKLGRRDLDTGIRSLKFVDLFSLENRLYPEAKLEMRKFIDRDEVFQVLGFRPNGSQMWTITQLEMIHCCGKNVSRSPV